MKKKIFILLALFLVFFVWWNYGEERVDLFGDDVLLDRQPRSSRNVGTPVLADSSQPQIGSSIDASKSALRSLWNHTLSQTSDLARIDKRVEIATFFEGNATFDNFEEVENLVAEEFGPGSFLDAIMMDLYAVMCAKFGTVSIGFLKGKSTETTGNYSIENVNSAIFQGLSSVGTGLIAKYFSESEGELRTMLDSPKAIQKLAYALSPAAFGNQEAPVDELMKNAISLVESELVGFDDRNLVIQKVAANFSSQRPFEAFDVLVKNGITSSESTNDVTIQEIAGFMMDRDPEKAMMQFESSSILSSEISSTVFENWVTQNSRAASEWFSNLESLGRSKNLDAYRSGFSSSAIQRGEFETASEWADEVSDPTVKADLEANISKAKNGE